MRQLKAKSTELAELMQDLCDGFGDDSWKLTMSRCDITGKLECYGYSFGHTGKGEDRRVYSEGSLQILDQ